jgi:hypothetical protein
MTHKKKVMIMRNIEKIRKQHSLGSELIIKMGLLAAIIGLLCASGASFYVVAGIYLGYKVLRLVLRLFWLVLALVFTVVSIGILITIILLLIF